MALELKYFVLKPRSKYYGDPWGRAARKAMFTFAIEIAGEDEELYHDLLAWIKREDAREESMARLDGEEGE